MAQPNNSRIYRQVKCYQFLQRQLDTDTALVEDDDGVIHELKTGGPWTVGRAHSLVVGDLWVLAGQSNMRGYGFFTGTTTTPTLIPVFGSDETWAHISITQPVHQLAASPRTIHHTLSDPTVQLPSLAFERGASLVPSFAANYRQKLGVPVGFIPCAHGGVTLEEWSKPNESLYGVMMDKIKKVGGQVTGVLWYQGESDATTNAAQDYQAQWTRWLDQLHKDVHDPMVIYCQIGRMVTEDEYDMGWNRVRQAQLDVYKEQKNRKVAMVATVDADLDDFIHLSKQGLDLVGYRLAMAAVDLWQQHVPIVAYGTGVRLLHTTYNHGTHATHYLRLDFNLPGLIWRQDRPITGFSIYHDNTRMDVIYSVRVSSEQHIDLYLTEIGYRRLFALGNCVLWYGYGRNPSCNLVTTSDIAAMAFGPLPIMLD